MPLTPIGEIIKNAAPNGANIGNGSSEIKACNGYNFCDNITSNQKQKQGLIESLLPHGAENAITAEQISKTLGISSVRYVRRLVSNERQSGRNILSTNASGGGYFLPAIGEQGQEEMQRFCAYRLSNICAAMKSIQHIQAEIAKNEKQMSLFSDNQAYYE